MFRAEFLVFAVEYLIFTELTFQCTVKQRHFHRWFQPDLVETLIAITQNPSIVAYESMFQPFAYHLIQTQQVVCRDAFTVRRIRDDDTLFGRLFKLLERLDTQYNVFAHSRRLYVMRGYFVRFRVIVVSVNLVCKFAFLRVIIINVVEKFLVEVFPLLESKFFAENPRSNVSGY